jgi:hypothetical protein
MVHRTDIVGSVGCGMGRVNPGDDGMCRHAPNGALKWRRKKSFTETAAYSSFGGKKCSRLFMTAVPSVHAVYVETGGPMKR